MCNLYKTKSCISNSEQLLSARPSGPTYPPACLQEHSAKPAMHQAQSGWAYKSFLDTYLIFAHHILASMTFNLLWRALQEVLVAEMDRRTQSGIGGCYHSDSWKLGHIVKIIMPFIFHSYIVVFAIYIYQINIW